MLLSAISSSGEDCSRERRECGGRTYGIGTNAAEKAIRKEMEAAMASLAEGDDSSYRRSWL
jgi:hypothetical protein